MKLEKIPMELLSLLVERHGQLVTREEIIARVWGKDVFLDTEQGINTAVRKIRQALKDDPENPRFVQTVVGKGYRFIATVEPNGIAPASSGPLRQTPVADGARTRGGLAAMVAVLCIMATYFVLGRFRLEEHGEPVRAETHRVAPEVYETYLKGEALWRSGEVEKSQHAFEMVIARDPQYAPAYASLAHTWSASANWLPPHDVMPKAEYLARQSLVLDPKLAEAHAVLGEIELRYRWDWVGAEEEMKHALELNPSSVTSHRIYGDYLMAMGRFEEALVERRKTAMLDPSWADLYMDVGRSLIKLERYEQAAAEFRRAQQLDPKSCDPPVGLSNVYERQGKYTAAMEEMRKQIELNGPSLQKHRRVVERVYARKGYSAARRALSRELVRERIRLIKTQYIPPMAIAMSSAKASETDISFAYVEKALQERSPGLAMLNAYDLPDEFRSDPRIAILLKRVGVPEPPTVLAANKK
jgi:Tfp pilus assembly protein PilF